MLTPKSPAHTERIRPAPKVLVAHARAELRDRRDRDLAELKDRKRRRDETRRGVAVAQVPTS